MKLRPDKPSADQPRSVVAVGTNYGTNWRVMRNAPALRYELQLFRCRQRGIDEWEDVAVETHRDDVIAAMKRHRLLDARSKATMLKLPPWIGASAGRVGR